MPVQKYKLGQAIFYLVFTNELGDFYRYHYDDEMRANNVTLEKEHLIKMGATPITEPDEELLEKIPALYRTDPTKSYLVDNINMCIQAINSLTKQLREMKGQL